MDGSPAISVREVASYLNVDEKTIYRLAKRGQLPGFKVAGIWRFKKNDIDHWIEEQKARAPKTGAPENQTIPSGEPAASAKPMTTTGNRVRRG